MKKIEELNSIFRKKRKYRNKSFRTRNYIWKHKIKFEIDPFKKNVLLNGLDDIALSLEKSEKILSYEEKNKKNKPWIN